MEGLQFTQRKMSNTKLKLSDLNPHLMCVLCGGYYIDATTIVECLHSFCRSCIVKHLESSKYCPICEVQVHKTKPLVNIRPDKTLQDIVYKLVPGLFASEMQNRRNFYKERPHYIKPNNSESVGEVSGERKIYINDENITFSLVYHSGVISGNSDDCYVEISPPIQVEKRYFKCPTGVTVYHLKKLLKTKYELNDSYYKMEIYLQDQPLHEDLTLLDISYIYLWKSKGNLDLTYKIFENIAKRQKIEVKEENNSTLVELVRQQNENSAKTEESMEIPVSHGAGQDEVNGETKPNSASAGSPVATSSSPPAPLKSKRENDAVGETKKAEHGSVKENGVSGREAKEVQLQISESGVISVSQVQECDVVRTMENAETKVVNNQLITGLNIDSSVGGSKGNEGSCKQEAINSRPESQNKQQSQQQQENFDQQQMASSGQCDEEQQRPEVTRKPQEQYEHQGRQDFVLQDQQKQAKTMIQKHDLPVPQQENLSLAQQQHASIPQPKTSSSFHQKHSSVSQKQSSSTSQQKYSSLSQPNPSHKTQQQKELPAQQSSVSQQKHSSVSQQKKTACAQQKQPSVSQQQNPSSAQQKLSSVTQQQNSIPVPQQSSILQQQKLMQHQNSSVMQQQQASVSQQQSSSTQSQKQHLSVSQQPNLTAQQPKQSSASQQNNYLLAPQQQSSVSEQHNYSIPPQKHLQQNTYSGPQQQSASQQQQQQPLPPPKKKPVKLYKTIRCSPKAWHPVITKEKLRPTLMKNSDEPRKPLKFFKMRNMPRFLGNPSSGVKPLYAEPPQNNAEEKKAQEKKMEASKTKILKIDPKTLRPIEKEETKIAQTPNLPNLLTNPFIPNNNHFLFSDLHLLPPNSGNLSNSKSDPKSGDKGTSPGGFKNPVPNGTYPPICFPPPDHNPGFYPFSSMAKPQNFPFPVGDKMDPLLRASRLSPFGNLAGFNVAGFHASLPPSISRLLNPHHHYRKLSQSTEKKNKADESTKETNQNCDDSININKANDAEEEEEGSGKRGHGEDSASTRGAAEEESQQEKEKEESKREEETGEKSGEASDTGQKEESGGDGKTVSDEDVSKTEVNREDEKVETINGGGPEESASATCASGVKTDPTKDNENITKIDKDNER